MGEKENGEEKEQEVVARVLSRFKPKEVRRRETTNQWRRRTTSQQDINKDLLFERLRWINLLNNESSSSSSPTTQNQHKTSFMSLVPPTQRTNFQQYKGTSTQEAKPEIEMTITKSFPMPMADHKYKLNASSNRFSNQIPFSDRGRFSFVRGCNRLAPAVQIRSVIPVYAAPPSKPNPNPSCVTKTPVLGGQEKNISGEINQTKNLDQTHD